MNIVFATNANAFWALEYIERVLLDYGNENQITVISMNNKSFSNEYEKYHIKIYSYEQKSRVFVKRLFGRKKLMKQMLRELGSIDVFHANYIDVLQLVYLYPLWKVATTRIMTYWGSDLLMTNKKDLQLCKFFLKRADYVTLMTQNMREKFDAEYGNTYKSKIRMLDFGCPMYRHIDTLATELSKEQCKDYWGIRGKIVVAVGYNRWRMQQHLKIIEAVSILDKELLQKCVFVLQLSYGGEGKETEEYLHEIENLLQSRGMNYLFIDKFLGPRESAILRLATDVFLYGQKSDALSASFCEYLYAGCIVTKPSWLDYYELEERDITYFAYNKFQELTELVRNVIEGEVILSQDAKIQNRNELVKLNSWDCLAVEWRKIYGIE